MRVLIVEDDNSIREALKSVLEFEDYDVHVESNGQKALDWLLRNPRPSLIILDLLMPVMDGFAFRTEQLKRPELATIPVIVITATEDPIDEAHRFHAVLYKPLELDSLTAAIRSVPVPTDPWTSEITRPEFHK